MELPTDFIPPEIWIQGTGQLYVTSAGLRGMLEVVPVGPVFQDAGATAQDQIPSAAGGAPNTVDLTAAIVTRITAPGGEVVDAISTDAPTGTETTGGLPYIMSYDVADGAGNCAVYL